MIDGNNVSLLLRRLDEIERKLDRIMEELWPAPAIGYSVRRGNIPRKDNWQKPHLGGASPGAGAEKPYRQRYKRKACFSHFSMALCTSFRSQQSLQCLRQQSHWRVFS